MDSGNVLITSKFKLQQYCRNPYQRSKNIEIHLTQKKQWEHQPHEQWVVMLKSAPHQSCGTVEISTMYRVPVRIKESTPWTESILKKEISTMDRVPVNKKEISTMDRGTERRVSAPWTESRHVCKNVRKCKIFPYSDFYIILLSALAPSAK